MKIVDEIFRNQMEVKNMKDRPHPLTLSGTFQYDLHAS